MLKGWLSRGAKGCGSAQIGHKDLRQGCGAKDKHKPRGRDWLCKSKTPPTGRDTSEKFDPNTFAIILASKQPLSGEVPIWNRELSSEYTSRMAGNVCAVSFVIGGADGFE